MNELNLLVPEQLPGMLSDAEVQRVLDYASAEKSAATLVAYASDNRDWLAWCDAHAACPLPAAPAHVCAYITALADRGLKASSIGRRVTSLAYYHRMAGIEHPPTNAQAVKSVLRGVRRTIGVAPVKKHAATADIVMRMLAHCGDDLIGKRDRALIAVGMSGAFRRSELVALTTNDIETTKEGLLITIRRSKGDQEGAGQVVSLPHGHHIRPVEALTQWIEMADISKGVLFRTVALGGRLGDDMSGAAVARVVKKLIARAGLERKEFSAHSLRSGFLSSAAEHGASVWKMQEQSRHRSLDVLSGYVRSKNRFVQHAGSGFL